MNSSFLPHLASCAAGAAVALLGSYILRSYRGEKSKDTEDQNEVQDLLTLLYNIAEDQARKEGFIHRGTSCSSCHSNPIRGIRFKCANCIDYDVCETCEPQDAHNRSHVFLQIRVPIPPLTNPRRVLLPPFYPGTFKNSSSHLSWETIKRLRDSSHFDHVELQALYEQYKSLSTHPGEEGGITLDVFLLCLGPLGGSKSLISDRLFKFFDRDGDGVVCFGELVAGLSILCKGSQQEKIIYAFRGYDLSNEGFLSREHLHQMLTAYFILSMELVREVVKILEEEMLLNFRDEGDRPVSAVFTAPLPAPPPHAPSLAARQAMLERLDEELLEEEDPCPPPPVIIPPSASTSPSPSRSPHVLPPGQGTHNRRHSGLLRLSPSMQGRAEIRPLMATLSQDAIDELVASAFEGADLDKDGRLSLEEFTRWAMGNPLMLSWFDALGSVF